MCKLSVDTCNKILIENITKTYKKSDPSIVRKINSEAKSTAKKLHLDDRIEQFANKKSYLTLKDHRENFENNPKCRLINPAKTEIAIISKHYLEKINSNIGKKTGLNQWRNTSSVIEWFKNIPEKQIKFDIGDFYPSISEQLLSEALQYAMHSRKSLLFDENNVWVKKKQ